MAVRSLVPVMAVVAWSGVVAVQPAATAADVIKANNTTNLNDSASWVGGTVPTASDVGVWNSTVTTANSTAYGANLSWQGIRIASPGGLVTLGTTAATETLTLGTSGIDMSAATQNLLLNGNVVAGGDQTWGVANGRTLQLFTINTARTLTGSGNIKLSNTSGSGTAIFDLRPGTNGSTAFTAQAGVSGFTGNWEIGPNTSVRTLRNGINAWGTGTIFLAGGTVGQQQNFSGAWTNTMELVTGTTSTIDDFNTSGTRYLQLNGVIQGAGNLTFQETNGSVTTNKDSTYTLAAANTMSGTVTVASGAFLRVGGLGGNNNSGSNNIPTAGTQGTLGAAAVVNNGGLSFTRTDTWAVANAISGTGSVNIGSNVADLAATSTQNVTLSGTNTYSGATTIYRGTLTVTGSLSASSAVSVASASTLAGNGTAAGAVTVANGGIISPGVANAGTLTLGSLTFGTAAGNTASIVMPVSAVGTLDSRLSVNGNLAANGGANTVTFNLGSNLPLLANGTYSLASYSGVLNDASAFAWAGTTGPRQTVVVAAGTQSIDLQVTNAFPIWTGAQGSDWSAANNWILSSDNQPTSFDANDVVVFNDSGTTGTVNLGANVNPSATTFSGNSLAYTIGSTGGFGITTGSLVKTGTAAVSITTTNSFADGTTVTAGTLNVGNGGTTGTLGSGAISVAAGAEVVFDRSNAFTVSNVLSGAGTIRKAGGGRMTVDGNNSGSAVNWSFTGTGNADIGFANANAVGGTGSTISLGANATGSAFFSSTGNTSDVAVALGSGSVLTWNGSSTNTNTLSGVISGAGSLTKVSGETLVLSGANT